jgi:hypothetical protein
VQHDLSCSRLYIKINFMQKQIVVIAALMGSFFITNSWAQSSLSKFQEVAPRQNIYVELGGNGVAFNAMYETRFKKAADGVGFKAGLGGFTSSYEKVFTLPLGVNWLLTKDNKHFFEMGFGATFLHYEDTYDWGWPGGGYEPYPVDVAGLTIDAKNSVYGHMTLGYRRQPASGGIMWGVAVTPQFNENGFWPVWIGFKFGYSFARK